MSLPWCVLCCGSACDRVPACECVCVCVLMYVFLCVCVCGCQDTGSCVLVRTHSICLLVIHSDIVAFCVDIPCISCSHPTNDSVTSHVPVDARAAVSSCILPALRYSTLPLFLLYELFGGQEAFIDGVRCSHLQSGWSHRRV